MQPRFPLFLGAMVILLATTFATLAQSSDASLSGRVLDQNKAAITGAQIILRNKGASRERIFVTDASGFLSIRSACAR
jgi:hypothetical protein